MADILRPQPSASKRKIYFSRCGENIAQFIVLPKKIGIR